MTVENLEPEFVKVLETFFCLSPRERVILDLRFGERKTQAEVAGVLNISNERVRQLETQALKTIIKKAKK